MKKWIASILLLTCITACDRTEKNFRNKTILDVNGHTLSAAAFADELAFYLKDQDVLGAKDPKTVSRAKNKIVEEFITKSLAAAWASDKGLVVKAEDVESEISKVQRSYPDDFAFREALAEQNLTFKDWRDRLRDSLLQRKVEGEIFKSIKRPTPDDELAYYNNNKESFRTVEAAEITQILVATESDAKRIESELKAGKRMRDLAKRHSISPEGLNGGNVGWVEKGTSDVFESAFQMKGSARSPIVKSSFGYHIFQVTGRRPSRITPFKDAQPQIRAILLEKAQSSAYLAWLEERIRKARVFKDQELIEAMTVETKGAR